MVHEVLGKRNFSILQIRQVVSKSLMTLFININLIMSCSLNCHPNSTYYRVVSSMSEILLSFLYEYMLSFYVLDKDSKKITVS